MVQTAPAKKRRRERNETPMKLLPPSVQNDMNYHAATAWKVQNDVTLLPTWLDKSRMNMNYHAMAFKSATTLKLLGKRLLEPGLTMNQRAAHVWIRDDYGPWERRLIEPAMTYHYTCQCFKSCVWWKTNDMNKCYVSYQSYTSLTSQKRLKPTAAHWRTSPQCHGKTGLRCDVRTDVKLGWKFRQVSKVQYDSGVTSVTTLDYRELGSSHCL